MAQHRENFRGSDIMLDNGLLTIDGVDIDITQTDTGRYVTSRMPYTDYTSIQDLAHAVVKHVPDFFKGAQS